MIVIRPDHDRHIEIPGVAAPVRRPVDVDATKTGFRSLRTLRIYRFAAQATIEGHAEEDEVFIVVLAGTIQLSLSGDAPVRLAAPMRADSVACAAYLPPGGSYTLVATTDADVAYVRATPLGTRPVRVFWSRAEAGGRGMTIQLEETEHAERLRLRLLQWDAGAGDVRLVMAAGGERLVHLRMMGAEGEALLEDETLRSWDTAAIAPEESPTLILPKGSSGLILLVSI